MALFSTIIPVYNRPELVVETIESVLGQTFKDQEIIVMDDGSSDRTPEVLRGYADRVKLLRQENQGLGAARNHAMAAATGEYVIFLDSDDLWFPWTLARMAEAVEKYKHPAIVLGGVKTFRKKEDLGGLSDGPLAATYFADYLASWRNPPWLAPSATAVKREALVKAGGFFIERMTHEENDAWLRIADAPGFVRITSPVCCGRREHGGNISAFSMRNVEGAMFLVDSEKKGKYPGGRARQKERRALIAVHMRPMTIGCVRAGEAAWGWRLFRRTFGWNLRLGRIRYLAAFMAMGTGSSIRGLLWRKNAKHR